MLGVDSSTQSTKVEARRLDDGALVASGRAAHPPTSPPVSEQDPRDWWNALIAACGELGDIRRDVVAISVAGQQHGLVVLDGDGVPVRLAPLWNDTTASAAAAGLVAELGARTWAEGCGSVPVAAFTIAKLAHLVGRAPELLHRSRKVMLPHDYLTWCLTGAHVTDRGDASGTGWFDPAAGRYRPDLLAAAVEEPRVWLERLPKVLGPGSLAGELTAGAGRALGLAPGAVVGVGTGDNMAAALGLGLHPGDVVMSLGTSGTVYSVSDTPTADASGAVAGFADATGRFLPLVCTLNATKVTDAVARWLGTDPAGLSDLALTAGPEPAEPALVPYFDGERTPNRPDASGTFHGLRTDTSREALARAAHDGVVCGLLDGLDALHAAGVAGNGLLFLVGGGARSAAYRQRVADLHEAPVHVPETGEVVATGAAVQAAALVRGTDPTDQAGDWELGASAVVEPHPNADGAETRRRYAAVTLSLTPDR